jgi:universal stress protein A
MLSLRTILHPTDFSVSAEFAFRLACSLARDHGARVVVMHVAGAAHADLYKGMPVVEQLEEHDRALMEKLHKVRADDAGIPVEHRMEKGVPADEIIRVAQEIGSDLIVLGTHGRTGLQRLLMGSVAEVVLRRATCPVLAVKAPALA